MEKNGNNLNDGPNEHLDPELQSLVDMADKMSSFDSDKEDNRAESISEVAHGDTDANGIPDGYNERGFNSDGVHFLTGTRRDPHGFNARGEYQRPHSRLSSPINPRGFDVNGHNYYTDSDLDLGGFNFDGINEETGEKYDKYGFDAEGYFHDTTRRENDQGEESRIDSNGADYRGFVGDSDINIRTNSKYDRNGFDKEGYDKNNRDLFGYDRDGFDINGIDRRGFARDGFNANGIDREGYDREGFDKDGVDREGYNREGLDKDGNTREFNARFNRYGLDEDGYTKNGEMDVDVELAINFAKSGVKDQRQYASEKGIDVGELRRRIELARKKCPNIDKIVSDLLLTGNKIRVATIINDCDEFIGGSLSMDDFWNKHPKLNMSEVLAHFMNNFNRKKQFSNKIIESLVLDPENIEWNLRIFGRSRYDVYGAIRGIESFKRIYTRFGTDGTPEQIQQKRKNTKKLFDAIKYFNKYRNRNLESLLGARQSFDGGQTWIEYNGEAIGRAMDALKKEKKLICVQTVKDYIIKNRAEK